MAFGVSFYKALERAAALAIVSWLVAVLVLVGWLLAGCARPPSPAAIEASAYGAELEACALQSSTCPGYVACRKRVAESHGRKYDGRCVP
jgi:hypothetical protein